MTQDDGSLLDNFACMCGRQRTIASNIETVVRIRTKHVFHNPESYSYYTQCLKCESCTGWSLVEFFSAAILCIWLSTCARDSVKAIKHAKPNDAHFFFQTSSLHLSSHIYKFYFSLSFLFFWKTELSVESVS